VQSSQVLSAAKDSDKVLVLAGQSSRKEGHLHLLCTFTRYSCKHAVYCTQTLRKATIDCNHSAVSTRGGGEASNARLWSCDAALASM
jgi:hypothetical protein